jgi:TetR/AcrR family transcriptional regulator
MTHPPQSGSEDTQSQMRHQQILDAAVDVFAEKGYQRATMRKIAARANISAGTIYIYFDGKRDLLLSIADQVIRQAWSDTQAQLASLDRETYIAAVLQNVFDFVHENQAFLQALIPEIWTDDELQDQFFNQILAPLFETGARNLEEQIAAGQARPCEVEIIVPTIAGSLIMLSLFHSLAPDQFLADFSKAEIIEELNRLYLNGLKPIPRETE